MKVNKLLLQILMTVFILSCQDNQVFRKNSVIVDNADISEANESMRILCRIRYPLEQDAHFTWFTEDGTAFSNDGDYKAVSKSELVIPAGEVEGELFVEIAEDTLDEENEYFKVILVPDFLLKDGAEQDSIEPIVVRVAIIDDDQPPKLTIVSNNIVIDEDGQHAEIAYNLSAVSGRTKQFRWATQDHTALSNLGDYTAQRGQWEKISPGKLTGILTVPIIDDQLYELDEIFKVVIDPSSLYGVMADAKDLEATVTIQDNDDPPIIKLEDIEVREDAGQVLVSYRLDPIESGAPISFSWSTRDGSATSSNDYTAQADQKVNIGVGSKNGALAIPIINDQEWNEGREDFRVVIDTASLIGVKAAGSRTEATVTINDDDELLAINLEDAVVREDAGQVNVAFSLSPVAGNAPVSFSWSTRNGSAIAGSDYTAIVNQRVKVEAKARSGVLTIPITNDRDLNEERENFQIIINTSSLTGVKIVGSRIEAVVTIEDDDIVQFPTISLADTVVREDAGQAHIPYSLSSKASSVPVSFSWSTRNGSAIAGSDYTAVVNQQVNMGVQARAGVLSIPITNDRDLNEGSEIFRVIINTSSMTGVKTAGSRVEAMVTVEDDDVVQLPIIRLADTVVREDVGQAHIPYSLGPEVSGMPVSFSWSTRNGSAIAGNDYTAVVNQKVNMGVRARSGVLTIPITNDRISSEGRESFEIFIDPSSLTGAKVSGSKIIATVTIENVVQRPTISLTDAVVRENVGLARVSYTLSTAVKRLPVSFSWSTRNGSAGAGSDYTAVAKQQVRIGLNSRTGVLTIPIINDYIANEGRESFQVIIDATSLVGINVVGSRPVATVTIEDDDVVQNPPVLTIPDQSIVIGNTFSYRVKDSDIGGTLTRSDVTIVMTSNGGSGVTFNNNIFATTQAIISLRNFTIRGTIANSDGTSQWSFNIRVLPDSRPGNKGIPTLTKRDIDLSINSSLGYIVNDRDIGGIPGGGGYTKNKVKKVNITVTSDGGIGLVYGAPNCYCFVLSRSIAYTGVFVIRGTISNSVGSSSWTFKITTVNRKSTSSDEDADVVEMDSGPGALAADKIVGLQSYDRGEQLTIDNSNRMPRRFTDRFVQSSDFGKNSPVDILWVIDNSSSISAEQGHLANNIERFIDNFITQYGGKNAVVDFKMAIITTNRAVDISGGMLTREKLLINREDFIANFESSIKVGRAPSSIGNEQGFRMSDRFLTNNSSWSRKDALLFIIYVSDKDDFSGELLNNWVGKLYLHKLHSSLLRVNAIVDTDTSSSDPLYGERYISAANMTGGSVKDIYNSFSSSLQGLGQNIQTLLSSFALTKQSIDETSIKVWVDGKDITSMKNIQWIYYPYTRTIQFKEGHIPPEGTTIVISYGHY